MFGWVVCCDVTNLNKDLYLLYQTLMIQIQFVYSNHGYYMFLSPICILKKLFRFTLPKEKKYI